MNIIISEEDKSLENNIIKLNIEPKQIRTAISLFSGAGGDNLGMKNAGFNVVGFVEIEKTFIRTHLSNFSETNLIIDDITKITTNHLDQYKDKIDVIFGGFPCQTFSHAGKKDSTDSRGFLYSYFLAVINYVRPRIAIGENVPGLLKREISKGNLFIDSINVDVGKIGYKLKTIIVDASCFGVPQKRKRLLLFIYRSEDEIIISDVMTKIYNYNKEPKISIKSIIEPSLENAIDITSNANVSNMIPQDKYFIINDNNIQITGNPATNLTKCYNFVYTSGLSFKSRIKSTYSCIEDIDEPTHTILCTYGRMPRLFIPILNIANNKKYIRTFTINELKQIQGFPKEFKMEGTNIEVITQIGNAIPPIVVRQIMLFLKESFEW